MSAQSDQMRRKLIKQNRYMMRTLDISIFELFAVVQLFAIENQTDLNHVDAFLLLKLILEPKNLVGRRVEEIGRSKRGNGGETFAKV